MKKLLENIKGCMICQKYLPYQPRPVLRAGIHSKIVIIGQAPGQKVQNSGIPWDDLSGNELRRWLGVSPTEFYDHSTFALIPMGFCYPGKGSSGDLPPRPECAPLWHQALLSKMKEIEMILLIGQYSQKYYLSGLSGHFHSSLTENVKRFREFLPQYFPLVHPSPRNKIWQKKNPWFETEVVPQLQMIVSKLIHRPEDGRPKQ